MARTIIDIPDALLHEVDSACKLLAISRAEAIRRALREYLQHHESVRADGFGLWKPSRGAGESTTTLRAAAAPVDDPAPLPAAAARRR